MKLENTVLGIELGSTRIKAVLLDEKHLPVASGDFEWENRLVDGIWTYSMDDVVCGIRACFAAVAQDVWEKFGVKLTKVGAIGISGMMHGYLPLNKAGEPIAEFRTWRNTITGEAAEKLTALFNFNIPQRWSIAHLYQTMLRGETHLSELDYLTTIAGYIHLKLTGRRVLGVGDASGIFPIDSETVDYNEEMVQKFNALAAEMGYSFKLREVLPEVLAAGEEAGVLTEEGARFLCPEGFLEAGIPLAPPEGDAGTGMTATNSVRAYIGNVSAGTSDFAMVVLDRALGPHREIDMVTTPSGLPVAMVHCNNCTSDINAWASLFSEFGQLMGVSFDKGEVFARLFNAALCGDPDCGGLLSFNYISGEGVTGFDEGCPVFLRTPDAKFTLANFMRMNLLSALCTLKIGLDILTVEEKVEIKKLYAQGGYFKTPGVGQRMLSAAVATPVSVMETAGEGGPYGMALLAAYRIRKEEGETLEDYLEQKVFADAKSSTLMASEADIAGFVTFLEKYRAALPVEAAAIAALR